MRSPRLGALMSRPAALLAVALDVGLRPRLASGAFAAAAAVGRPGSPSGRRLADAHQHALGGLEIGQLRGDRCAVGVEACKPLADLLLFRADLVQYPRCGSHGGLQWFQVNRDDQPCWRLTPQCAICNPRMHRLSAFAPARLSGKRPMVRGMLCPASRGKGKWTTAAC